MAFVLVTGGAGFIGSHVCKALHQAGHTPVTYDNLSRGFRQAVKWGPFIEGDIHDVSFLQQALQEHKVSAVIHLAAYAYVAESVEKPKMYFENNVDGTALLLEAMSSAGVDKLVFSSSCAVYGESKADKIDEAHPTNPINPYGLSKLMGEKMVQKWAELENQACCLRYFNAAGADPEGEIGENHDPEPHLIPLLIKKVMKDETLTLNGDDYPTSDGTCVRDFIHVSDLAESHVLVLEKLLTGEKIKPVYNLGKGQGYSLKEVAQAILKTLDKDNPITINERREGDPAFLVGDARLFQKEFQFKFERSNLEEMISSTYRWIEKSHKQNSTGFTR